MERRREILAQPGPEDSLRPGEGLAGRVLQSGEPESSPAGAAFPIASASGTLGALELYGAGVVDSELSQVLLAIGRHLGERIERERAYEHGQASEQLLAEAERAAGAGSFEADLRTGVAECSAGRPGTGRWRRRGYPGAFHEPGGRQATGELGSQVGRGTPGRARVAWAGPLIERCVDRACGDGDGRCDEQ